MRRLVAHRVTEVNGETGADGEFGVAGHFLTLIPGHTVTQELGQYLHFFGKQRGDAISAAIVGNPHEHGEPTSPLDRKYSEVL